MRKVDDGGARPPGKALGQGILDDGRSLSQRRLRRRSVALLALSVALPLSLYLALATRLIRAHVGYHMDEALYVESAVYLLRGTPEHASWTATHGRRWPLMIIPYVGTAKALVALPLFAIFGISAEVARFSGVLLGCLGIAGLVILIGTQVGRVAGLIPGVFLAIHPSYLDFTVFDNGGVSVWMAAMGLAALSLANHLCRRSRGSAFLLGFAAGLGVWARANVLWLIAAAIVAALLAFGRRSIPRRDHWKFAAIGCCFGALPLIVYEIGSRLATLQYIGSAWRLPSATGVTQRLRATIELVISDGEQRGIWGGPPPPSWQIAIGAVLLLLVLLCACVPLRSEGSPISRWRRSFALSAVVLTAIMLASGLGISQHHLVAVLPLALCALAVFSLEIGRRFRPATIPLVAAGVALAVLCWSWDVRIDHGLRSSKGRGLWSRAIEDVGRYLESHPVSPRRLKILHWGFQNNLYVLSGGSVYGSELYWGATKERSSRGLSWESEIRDGGSFLLFLFPVGPPPLDCAAEGFTEAFARYQGPRQERRFFDRSGSPIARIVEIPPRLSARAVASRPAPREFKTTAGADTAAGGRVPTREMPAAQGRLAGPWRSTRTGAPRWDPGARL